MTNSRGTSESEPAAGSSFGNLRNSISGPKDRVFDGERVAAATSSKVQWAVVLVISTTADGVGVDREGKNFALSKKRAIRAEQVAKELAG
jgi:hypothetical protein